MKPTQGNRKQELFTMDLVQAPFPALPAKEMITFMVIGGQDNSL